MNNFYIFILVLVASYAQAVEVETLGRFSNHAVKSVELSVSKRSAIATSFGDDKRLTIFELGDDGVFVKIALYKENFIYYRQSNTNGNCFDVFYTKEVSVYHANICNDGVRNVQKIAISGYQKLSVDRRREAIHFIYPNKITSWRDGRIFDLECEEVPSIVRLDETGDGVYCISGKRLYSPRGILHEFDHTIEDFYLVGGNAYIGFDNGLLAKYRVHHLDRALKYKKYSKHLSFSIDKLTRYRKGLAFHPDFSGCIYFFDVDGVDDDFCFNANFFRKYESPEFTEKFNIVGFLSLSNGSLIVTDNFMRILEIKNIGVR